ncbi:MAG: L,D-transpeptidase [Pseudorhodobacter sp.]|nr:L,D-transpeptidase [Pseudorhodobacter sp.]
MFFSPFVSRRHFIIAGLATGAALTTPAFAAAPEGWVLPEHYRPTIVRTRITMNPGEIHVDPNRFALYLTLPDKKAIRYMVGIGRGNLYESGLFRVGAKKEWPSWTPTREMIVRSPEHYAQYADGMPGGPSNPLGARALYLFDDRRGDTFLRIHGTPEPWTVGSAVSNGCVRLVNEHVTQLFDQVEIGAVVVLNPKVA